MSYRIGIHTWSLLIGDGLTWIGQRGRWHKHLSSFCSTLSGKMHRGMISKPTAEDMCVRSLRNINHKTIGKFPWIHHKDKPIVLHWAHLDYLLTPHSLQHRRGQKVLCMGLDHLLKTSHPARPFYKIPIIIRERLFHG